MEYAKILDSVIIEDSFSLPEKEIFSLALDIAQERAASHGWSSIQVRPSSNKPTKVDNKVCFSFDVYGIEKGELEPSNEATSKESKPDQKFAAASPDLAP